MQCLEQSSNESPGRAVQRKLAGDMPTGMHWRRFQPRRTSQVPCAGRQAPASVRPASFRL